MFYDEARGELEKGLGGEPGWTSRLLDEGGVDWAHEESGTTVRVWDNGAIVVINALVLSQELARYDDALRNSASMDQWIELATALTTRNEMVLVDWFGSHGLNA